MQANKKISSGSLAWCHLEINNSNSPLPALYSRTCWHLLQLTSYCTWKHDSLSGYCIGIVIRWVNYRMFNLLQNNIKETAGIVVLWKFPAQTRVLAGCKSPLCFLFVQGWESFLFFKDIWWEWVILISGKRPAKFSVTVYAHVIFSQSHTT